MKSYCIWSLWTTKTANPSPDLFSENVSQRINTENIRHDDGVIGEASEQQRATTEQPSQLGRPEPEGEEQFIIPTDDDLNEDSAEEGSLRGSDEEADDYGTFNL